MGLTVIAIVAAVLADFYHLWRVQDLVIVPFIAVFALGLLYVTIAFILRCPHCGRHIFVQWVEEPPFPNRGKGADTWASIVIKVAKRQSFQRMYCGQHYSP